MREGCAKIERSGGRHTLKMIILNVVSEEKKILFQFVLERRVSEKKWSSQGGGVDSVPAGSSR